MPLELFFDLVFVLAITQTTALIAHEQTWTGVLKGMLVLAAMWWIWTAYSWLTSVLDPEDGIVRLHLAVAMAALLVCAICMPSVFGRHALLFAGAYGLVAFIHLALFLIASREDPGLRRATLGLAAPTVVAVALLAIASQADGTTRIAVWGAAVAIAFGGGLIADSSGWKLQPRHFAERHGAVIIIALGESIVAIGAGVERESLGAQTLVAIVLGVLIAFSMWWLYFDVIATVSARRLAEAEVGSHQNRLARDAYSYLHLPMVAGIVLVALGLGQALARLDAPLGQVPRTALFAGFALYLAGHLLFRWRIVSTLDRERFPEARNLNRERLACALLLLVAAPLLRDASALVLLFALTAAAALLLAYEVRRQGDFRRQVRARIGGHGA